MKRPALRRLREYSPRDLLIVGIPLLMVVLAGFWLASRYIRPAPPDTLILSTGGEGGAYQRFAAIYKDILAQQDIRLVERPSAGSLENLARLRDPAADIDAAFVQGGAARVQEEDELLSLGTLYNEPLWIFYRADLGLLTQLTELKGARIAIGPEGSGTRHLALELLHANRLEPQQLRLRKQGGAGAGQCVREKPDRCGLCRRSCGICDDLDAAAYPRFAAAQPLASRSLYAPVPLSHPSGTAARCHRPV